MVKYSHGSFKIQSLNFGFLLFLSKVVSSLVSSHAWEIFRNYPTVKRSIYSSMTELPTRPTMFSLLTYNTGSTGAERSWGLPLGQDFRSTWFSLWCMQLENSIFLSLFFVRPIWHSLDGAIPKNHLLYQLLCWRFYAPCSRTTWKDLRSGVTSND